MLLPYNKTSGRKTYLQTSPVLEAEFPFESGSFPVQLCLHFCKAALLQCHFCNKKIERIKY